MKIKDVELVAPMECDGGDGVLRVDLLPWGGIAECALLMEHAGGEARTDWIDVAPAEHVRRAMNHLATHVACAKIKGAECVALDDETEHLHLVHAAVRLLMALDAMARAAGEAGEASEVN